MTNRALVIGASGGIGAALCSSLAASGAEVTRLSRATNGFDITDPSRVQSLMGGLKGTFDTVLIASGILAAEGERPEKSLSEIDADNMARVLAVNAIGPALVLRHLPRILPGNDRSVVGVPSRSKESGRNRWWWHCIQGPCRVKVHRGVP